MKKLTLPIGVIMMITLTAKNTSTFLPAGRHVVSIKSVTPAHPEGETEWKDKTQQLKVTYVAKDGKSFSAWYNLQGFKLFKDLTAKEKQSNKFISMGDQAYAVVKATGMRVQDEEKTAGALNILSKLAFDSGIGENEQFTEASLVGRTVGVVIGDNERMNPRVKNTFAPSEAALEEAQLA